MEQKEYKPLSDEFLENFLLEAQHCSGLPLINPISIHYIQCLRMANFANDLLPTLMEDLIDGYMMLVHDVHQLNRTWKSYDW